MKAGLNLIICGIGFLVLGCGKPTSGPLLSTVPQLLDIPQFAPLAMREVPQTVRDQLTLRLNPGSNEPSSDEYVNSPGAQAAVPGERPSVIISVPLEATQAARRAADLRAQGVVPISGSARANTNPGALESFQTDGYYNEAEQQIETALIRRGFDVRDRSRFEATLRDLRDQGEAYRECGRYCDIAANVSTQAARDLLSEQLTTGQMDLAEYQRVLEEVNRRAVQSTPGQRRTEDEMIDIAEVIRAAQSGSETADYLLQISVVQVEPASNRPFSIGNYPETRAFLDRHPGLQMGTGPDKLPASIPSRWYRAEFNAKLMSIRTGSIVWLGNHELSSQDAEPLTIVIGVRRSVANAEAVQTAIRNYNTRGERLLTQASQVRARLQTLYAEAQSPRQFENDEAMQQWESETRNRMAASEREYTSLRQQLVELSATRPPEFDQDFQFEYTVDPPQVTPDLTNLDLSEREAQEQLNRHHSNLIRAVTRSLIETILVVRE